MRARVFHSRGARMRSTRRSVPAERAMRQADVILGFIRAVRRRKGTEEEKSEERSVKKHVRRLFSEWKQKMEEQLQSLKSGLSR